MKLKNIFLSILTVAAFTGCSNEDLVGPEKIDYQGGDVVLMINGSTREDVETKANDKEDGDKDNSGDLLYVFVYDASGNFLGGGKSDETSEVKAQKVADVLYSQKFTDPLNKWSQDGNGQDKIAKDIAETSPNDVIVSGTGLVSGENVDVILIANPTEEIKAAYNKKVNLAELNTITADLATQINMYENDGHSTACQRIKIDNLARGINYCGKNKYAPVNEQGNSGKDDKRDWWTEQYSDQIPLYRLISQVNLKSIYCASRVSDSNEENANFVLQKAYLEKGTFSDKCNAVPGTSIIVSGEVDAVSNYSWCKNISKSIVSTEDSRNLYLKLGDNTGIVNETWAGIVITYGTTADGNCCTHVAHQKVGNTYYPRVGSWSGLTGPLYALGNTDGSSVSLVLEGYYNSGADDISSGLIIKRGTYVKYVIPIKNDDNSFHRNTIYNVSVTIKGIGREPDEKPDIDTSELVGVTANIEIANMSEVNSDFVFGEDEE